MKHMDKRIVATLCTILIASFFATKSVEADPVAPGYEIHRLVEVPTPRGLVEDGDELLLLTIDGKLQRYELDGTLTSETLVGGGSWVGPVISPTGAIYVSNYSGHYVAEVVDGVSTPIANIYAPGGLAISDDGSTLFVSSYLGHRVYTIDLTLGSTHTPVECVGVHSGRYPDALELWNGDLYIGYRGTNTVEVVQGGCGTRSIFASDRIVGPIDLRVDGDGLLVANFGDGSVRRIAQDGTVTDLIGGFVTPVGLARDSSGALVVADYNGGELWRVSQSTVRGTFEGYALPFVVTCRNLTKDTEVTIPIVSPDENYYDCAAAGLIFAPDDELEVVIPGSVAPGGAMPPPFEFTQVPVYGSTTAILQGYAEVNEPSLYAVATYIKVGGWWTKPTWANPTVLLDSYGNFAVNINTGGNDRYATEIVAYLIAKGYPPTQRSGQPHLPAELELVGVAKATATRSP